MRKRLLFETNYGISHGRWQKSIDADVDVHIAALFLVRSE